MSTCSTYCYKSQRIGARKDNVKAVLEMTDIEEKLEQHLRRVEKTEDGERREKILRRLRYCSEQIECTMREFHDEKTPSNQESHFIEEGSFEEKDEANRSKV